MNSTLPNIGLYVKGNIKMTPERGNMVYKYAPFFNLKTAFPTGEVDLQELNLESNIAQINTDNPLDITIEESYDGSANLIINDSLNPLKIVNSRFYLTSSSRYEIADRKGNLDTNIYTENNFKVETNLIKSVQSIVKTEFTGLLEGGKMSVGNYTFYFKLSDSDGNESDFIAESGKVVCHIGNINKPKFIRGGLLNENSGKSVNFKLKNLDLAYNFINVYYTRTTGDSDQETTLSYKIEDSFKIRGIDTDISITGYEETSEISLDDINIRYAEFEAVKTAENCQNITFSGGVTNNFELYSDLEKYSLHITPRIVTDKDIGNLSHNYVEQYNKEGGNEYYNVNNIYYKLGYWDQEIYRLGIIYIMNDYTLSPVFNIRGTQILSENTEFTFPELGKPINYQEDFIIENTNGKDNAKGVFKIDSKSSMFRNNKSIVPIAIKIDFNSNVVDGGNGPGLKDITKGFFIVRQKRIPTILAQAIGAASTVNGHLPTIKRSKDRIIESFLTSDTEKRPKLGASLVPLKDTEVVRNVLICPEAALRTEVYNSYFNSSEYTLIKSSYQPNNPSLGFRKSLVTDSHYYLGDLVKSGATKNRINSSLLLVEPGIDLIKNNAYKFSSKAGDSVIPHDSIDVKYGDYADPKNTIANIGIYNDSATKIRGIFNTYIGSDYSELEECSYYNIYQKDYDFETNWGNYFKLRYNDSSPYFPISDRISYEELRMRGTKETELVTEALYRGDCYINTYTHRINWNFIDPELPTNNRIVDRYTWHKNYRVDNKASTIVNKGGTDAESLQYNKLLPLFTYKSIKDVENQEDGDVVAAGLVSPEGKRFKKYSERNGLFGFDKMNRPDINAVGLGIWVTYKICSNVNLAMRDVDLTRPSEEAVHGMKRSFYPLQSIEKDLKLPESRVINKGISKTSGDRYYFEIPDVPFIKTYFPTRVYHSNILQQSSFVNGNRVFLSKNYQDYTMEYGALVKLVEWYGTLIAVMEHGVLQIPVNERAMMKNESGENIYINTDTVLPKNPKVLSNTFGSMWEDAVIKTDKYVYGLDTVGKKIWRTNGEMMEVISDITMQKFLNDNIDLKESDQDTFVGTNVIKTHYNAFKQDVLFTYKYGETKWHICWNELLDKWITRYSWFPEFSENTNNIFYTFANKDLYKNKQGVLYKHGFAGTIDIEGEILPTKWYDKQEPFEFEFIVAPQPGVQKIYDNFNIISNKVQPNSFIYEILGDGFEWQALKPKIIELNKQSETGDGLNTTTGFGSPFELKF